MEAPEEIAHVMKEVYGEQLVIRKQILEKSQVNTITASGCSWSLQLEAEAIINSWSDVKNGREEMENVTNKRTFDFLSVDMKMKSWIYISHQLYIFLLSTYPHTFQPVSLFQLNIKMLCAILCSSLVQAYGG